MASVCGLIQPKLNWNGRIFYDILWYFVGQNYQLHSIANMHLNFQRLSKWDQRTVQTCSNLVSHIIGERDSCRSPHANLVMSSPIKWATYNPFCPSLGVKMGQQRSSALFLMANLTHSGKKIRFSRVISMWPSCIATILNQELRVPLQNGWIFLVSEKPWPAPPGSEFLQQLPQSQSGDGGKAGNGLSTDPNFQTYHCHDGMNEMDLVEWSFVGKIFLSLSTKFSGHCF